MSISRSGKYVRDALYEELGGTENKNRHIL